MTGRLFRAARALISALAIGCATAASAQQPSPDQVAAVRSACPSDYRANCAGVPPGGKEALACLAKNADRLSPACRTAATGGTAPPAAAASPSPAVPAPAATPDTAAAPPVPAAPKSGPAPAAPAMVSPREEFALLRFGCGPDVRSLCPGTPPRGGRIVACLSAHRAALSPLCVRALSNLR